MKTKYENKEEDKLAIDLVNSREIKTLKELEEIYKKENLPFRERYVFYFISRQHHLNEIEKSDWGTDKCKYQHFSAYSGWWEDYLTYYRPMKMKIREELHPELPRLEYLETSDLDKEKVFHPKFIERGWEYHEGMNIFFDEMALIDFDNPLENGISKGISILQVYDELKQIDKEYDTYTFTIDKSRKTVVDAQWCPACHEAPCMCSDPF